MNRVVITGIGCVTPIGSSAEAVWAALESGRTGIKTIPEGNDGAARDAKLKFSRLGLVESFDAEELSATQLATTERSSQMALVAARQAAGGAAGMVKEYAPGRVAIVLGCSVGGQHAEEPAIVSVQCQDGRVHPLAIARAMASNGAAQVAIDQGTTGPAFTVSTACASGAHAIGLAFHMVRGGMVSAALAGAHEAALTKTFLRAWDSMRVVSPTMCRPFAADRDGMTLAEGAAVLKLETLAAARARGATIYAEVLGFGMSADAHHITQPLAQGPAQAMREALEDAALTLHGTDQPGDVQSLLEQVRYINAHGTGTRANDAAEAAALEIVFGARLVQQGPRQVAVSGTKGFHGHSLGASSAIEAMITALALRHRRLPFTLGTKMRDPELGLNLIVDEPRAMMDDGPVLALTNALAFGGLNAVLALRSLEG